MKKIFIALLTMMAALLGAQQISRVGVVDLNKVYSQFFRESEAVRRLEELRTTIQREVARQNEEINQIERNLLEARAANDSRTVLNLEQSLQQKKDYLREFVRVRQAQLNSERESLTRSNSFLTQILGQIRFVAESKGFTMILRTDDPNLLYYNVESDITEDVIKRLSGE